MANRDIIVIGASAGGVEALRLLVAELPPDLPAAVFVVVHIGLYGRGLLPEILKRAGQLPATEAQDHEKFERGHIYVAPSDRHLLLDSQGRTRVTRGPKENLCRPAVDPLFRSAALAFGSRVIGVVLTGNLDDGTAGLWAIRERGGIAIVQHPEEAVAPSMPSSALRHVEVQHCLRLREIGPLLVQLSRTPIPEEGGPSMSLERMETEVKIAEEDQALESGIKQLGEPSLYACPECHGVLLQIKEGSHLRFRCHTGHAYSIESLMAEFTRQNEDTLWNAFRSLEENEMLMRQMAAQLTSHSHREAATALLTRAEATKQRSQHLRQVLLQEGPRAVEGI